MPKLGSAKDDNVVDIFIKLDFPEEKAYEYSPYRDAITLDITNRQKFFTTGGT
jgi:hypothetical protein